MVKKLLKSWRKRKVATFPISTGSYLDPFVRDHAKNCRISKFSDISMCLVFVEATDVDRPSEHTGIGVA